MSFSIPSRGLAWTLSCSLLESKSDGMRSASWPAFSVPPGDRRSKRCSRCDLCVRSFRAQKRVIAEQRALVSGSPCRAVGTPIRVAFRRACPCPVSLVGGVASAQNPTHRKISPVHPTGKPTIHKTLSHATETPFNRNNQAQARSSTAAIVVRIDVSTQGRRDAFADPSSDVWVWARSRMTDPMVSSRDRFTRRIEFDKRRRRPLVCAITIEDLGPICVSPFARKVA